MTRLVRVARRTREAADVVSLELVDPQGQSLPPFTAGAHIDVHLGDGLIRQYSLCNAPHEAQRYVVAVLREPASRGGSAAMHALEVGQSLQVSEPRNHFALAEGASNHLLVAGGIGITPILSMAEHLSRAGASFGLHYAARSRERTAFVSRLAGADFADRVQLHFDDGPPAQRIDAARLIQQAPAQTHLYVCGPSGFMSWVLGAARDAGWEEARLHREHFSGAEAGSTADDGFEIQIASTGAVIAVAPGQSAISALAGHGIHLPVSCEQGVCGTCVTRVLDGTPEHRDVYLTPAEQAANDCFTPCCSRAQSRRLVLDL